VIGVKFVHGWYPKFSYPNNLSSGQTLHKIKVRAQTNTLSFNINVKFNPIIEV